MRVLGLRVSRVSSSPVLCCKGQYPLGVGGVSGPLRRSHFPTLYPDGWNQQGDTGLGELGGRAPRVERQQGRLADSEGKNLWDLLVKGIQTPKLTSFPGRAQHWAFSWSR
jgi:hypothetical protein